eukprot:gene271-356_t
MSLQKIKKSILPVVLHLGLMIGISIGLLLVLFQWGLPALTKHGQTITVPNLKGVSLDELQPTLTARHLRYQLTEEVVFLPHYPPAVILEQYPKPGARVKEGRTIYVTLNATQPPQVAMPHLIDGSVRNAHVLLKSRGLAYGTLTYIPDIAKNAVLQQWYLGQPIEPGAKIPQGALVDLVVGAGIHPQEVIVPDLIGMNTEEAELYLLDAGMCVKSILHEYVEALPNGSIFKQSPQVGSQVKLGTPVQLWAAEVPPTELTNKVQAVTSTLHNGPIDTFASPTPIP